MKKLISKIKNKINNSGSSLVLVIVALAFVGILTGALLTAVAYVYRLKLYDYNAKSNFYYLEQAMDEVYSGLGSQTMIDMQEDIVKLRKEISEIMTISNKEGVVSTADLVRANKAYIAGTSDLVELKKQRTKLLNQL